MGGVIAIVASVVAIATTVPWASVLPYSQAQHDADIQQVKDDYTLAQDAIIKAIEDSRMEWRCDEWEEELAELLESDEATPITEERIIRLREKIDENDCHRFDED